MIDWLENIDRNLLLTINSGHTPFLDQLMWLISEKYFGIPFYLLFLYLAYRTFGTRGMLLFLFLGVLCIGTTDLSSKYLFKEIFLRYRPSHNVELQDQLHYVNNYHGGTYGFISSHSANLFSITSFALFAFWNESKKGLLLLIVLFPMIVAYSRVYLGVHYPSDVIVGAFWGILIGWISYRIFDNQLIGQNR
ncbi:MAG: phosphatase PAP2 family protein [Flavobacteriales bacterium]|nr:phosphatase PAP2 family protein [Flavobacteriales bacterium]